MTLQLSDLTLGKPPTTAKQVSYRKMKAIDKTTHREELMSTELCLHSPDTLDELVNCYNDILLHRFWIDEHPFFTKFIKSRRLVPWFNDDIKTARREII